MKWGCGPSELRNVVNGHESRAYDCLLTARRFLDHHLSGILDRNRTCRMKPTTSRDGQCLEALDYLLGKVCVSAYDLRT